MDPEVVARVDAVPAADLPALTTEDAVPPVATAPAAAAAEEEAAAVKPEPAAAEAVAAEDKAAKKTEADEPKGPKYLDLAFAMDCTGSMGSYIHQAQQNIRTIVEEIVSKEQADIRLALVQYRDHPPQDSTFVTKTNDFTESVRTMKGWLEGCSAQGGGDGPEAVADGLHQVLKLSWREEATKICVFISDAPPHGLDASGDGFPNGCPAGLDPMDVTNQLAEKGVMIYMVGCEPSILPYRDFFMALAEITGGQYVPLASAAVLAKVIIGGAQEEISLAQLRQEVNQEVIAEMDMLGDDECVMQEAISKKIHGKMQSKGFKTKQLRMNKSELPQATSEAKMLSEYNCMADVKSKWASAPSSSSRYTSSTPARHSRSKGTAKRSKASGGGLFGGMMSWFGGSSSSAPSEDLLCAEPPMHAMAAAPPSAPTSADAYEVEEDEICEAQTSRMVQQAIMSNKISRAKCKKSA